MRKSSKIKKEVWFSFVKIELIDVIENVFLIFIAVKRIVKWLFTAMNKVIG
jgi:hypothetical protein